MNSSLRSGSFVEQSDSFPGSPADFYNGRPVIVFADGNYRWLLEHYAPALFMHQDIYRAQVNGDIWRKYSQFILIPLALRRSFGPYPSAGVADGFPGAG